VSGLIDPAPLSLTQAQALAVVATRELSWVIPGVSEEVSHWRKRALAMPASPIRDDALTSLDTKRFHTEGAALFATLPMRRDERLLRLLIVQELIWDFLDSVSERPTDDIVQNGWQLHHALSDALDPDGQISDDYYRFHPWKDDGGYLRELVETSRALCASLPLYERVREIVVRKARLARVCAINHEPDPELKRLKLRAFAIHEFPNESRLAWYEATAAASSSLSIYSLLALAVEPSCRAPAIAARLDAYAPWVDLSCIMLDSFADLVDDSRTGAHSYLSHYPSFDVAVNRLRQIVWSAARSVSQLPDAARHTLLATSMVAMYLSKDSASSGQLQPAARSILKASGSLPGMLWPILRLWRRLTAREAY
jgi:tetraprenyl-beta-curcumene synthase